MFLSLVCIYLNTYLFIQVMTYAGLFRKQTSQVCCFYTNYLRPNSHNIRSTYNKHVQAFRIERNKKFNVFLDWIGISPDNRHQRYATLRFCQISTIVLWYGLSAVWMQIRRLNVHTSVLFEFFIEIPNHHFSHCFLVVTPLMSM